MAEPQDEPVFVVKLTGILRQEDIEKYARKFSEQLPGRVVVVDNRVDDIYKMTRLEYEKLATMLSNEVNVDADGQEALPKELG